MVFLSTGLVQEHRPGQSPSVTDLFVAAGLSPLFPIVLQHRRSSSAYPREASVELYSGGGGGGGGEQLGFDDDFAYLFDLSTDDNVSFSTSDRKATLEFSFERTFRRASPRVLQKV